MVNPRTLSTLSLVNDVRHAAAEALDRERRYPALLLFYSFIDICAALSEEIPQTSNRNRFEAFVTKYAVLSWELFRPYDLWAARSSMLHAYSPRGHHTGKKSGAKPIFYFACPETESEMRQVLTVKGYCDFLLLDIETIAHVADSTFSAMWTRIESEPNFEAIFLRNAEHILMDLQQIHFEEELFRLTGQQT